MKFGYYHYSSHFGDEFLVNDPSQIANRINYVRETLALGVAAYLSPSVRVYTETGWAFHTDGGARPWEFQFGAEFAPTEPTGPGGSPFAAINGHLHQEDNFSGNLTVEAGWLWRGRSGHTFRTGMIYFNGMSDQAQFYNVRALHRLRILVRLLSAAAPAQGLSASPTHLACLQQRQSCRAAGSRQAACDGISTVTMMPDDTLARGERR